MNYLFFNKSLNFNNKEGNLQLSLASAISSQQTPKKHSNFHRNCLENLQRNREFKAATISKMACKILSMRKACEFTDSNSVLGLVILTQVFPVCSWDPPEEKKDASLLSVLLYSYSAAALSCVKHLISVLMQEN